MTIVVPPSEAVVARARLVDGVSLLVSTFQGKSYKRLITRMTVIGPSGSACSQYVGAINSQSLVDTTPRGDRNSNDLINPILVPAGMPIFFVWSVGTGSAIGTIFQRGDA